MRKRTEAGVGPVVGLACDRNFVGFFNVPVQSTTQDNYFDGYSEKLLHFSHLL